MLFEYIPQTFQDDISNILWLKEKLPISGIIIPANPISRPYPDSILCASLLQKSLHQKYGRSPNHKTRRGSELHFIPTIKSNIHTEESLQSAFLSLKYSHLSSVAIVSGDSNNTKDNIQSQAIKPLKLRPISRNLTTHENPLITTKIKHIRPQTNNTSKSLTTQDALSLLLTMSRQDSYFSTIRIFCAIDSNLSARNLHSLRTKLTFGVRNFITQPFYHISSKRSNLSSQIQLKKNAIRYDVFKNHLEILDYEYFLTCIQHYIATLPFGDTYRNVRFHCGFLPLFKEKSARNLHNKHLGIKISQDYIQSIANNALQTNLSLLCALKNHDVSMSYLNFKEIQNFLEFAGNVL